MDAWLSPIDGGDPRGSVANELIDSADWLTRAFDLQGFRLDDVKGQSSDCLHRFLNRKSMAGKFAVGEYFDGNVGQNCPGRLKRHCFGRHADSTTAEPIGQSPKFPHRTRLRRIGGPRGGGGGQIAQARD